MNLTDLRASERIIFETITGSTAYGLNTPTSDIDYRGIFYNTPRELLSLQPHQDEVGDDKQDIKFYSLKKFFELAKDCNPNICELLFMPEHCIVKCTPAMLEIIRNRKLFVSTKAKHTFSGYAFAQIKKAKGQNKWVNNPQKKENPTKEDFCFFIDVSGTGDLMKSWPQVQAIAGNMPGRPVLYKDATYNGEPLPPLDKCRVAAVEHVHNLYRLYSGGKGVFEDGVVRLDSFDDAIALARGKGVFRDGQLVCESIPMDQEWRNFIGLFLYNEEAYNAAMRDHKNYWEWVKNRNTNRWVSQEKGEVDYDVKNMMHCVRLLKSGINILKHGEPIIRWTGDDQKFLMDIRSGKFTHDYLISVSEALEAELDALYETSPLPREVNMAAIDDLYLGTVNNFR